ncbi:MAG TPA: GTPase Era [bacterium]|nr:GTPase Era [bacterium]
MNQAFRSGFVCLVGRPNVGKSTLLNRLVGREIAITAPKPQTTRNRIMGVRHGEGFQVVYVDTPGIHASPLPLNQRMVSYATASLQEADLVLVLTEPGPPTGEEDRLVLEHVRHAGRPALLVLNKIDTASEGDVLAALQAWAALDLFAEIVPISALTGRNVQRLERLVVERLPEGPPYFEPEQITDQSEPALIGELVRREVIQRTHQELPYRTAVRVEHMEEQARRVLIVASIFVERDSQKGIVIGKGGRMLKSIGIAARKQIERLLGVTVHLDLQVRVLERWSESPRHLESLGYPKP